jgi:CcmD family protein
MSEWSYVIAAFGLTWAVLAGYALFLNQRLGRARRAVRSAEAER